MTAWFDPPIQCIGHRGAAGLAPENTLAGFLLAQDLGVPAVELDVHLCEGKLVVVHDEDLSRTTNGQGRVVDASLAALRELDAGDGERVPLLAEVFEALSSDVLVNVELKGAGTAAPTIRLLTDLRIDRERVLLSAFDHDQLRQAHSIDARWMRGALFDRSLEDAIPKALTLGAVSLHCSLKHATRDLVASCHEAGLRCLCYTVNTASDMLRLQEWGMDGLFTDYPDRMGELLPGSLRRS